MELYIKNFQGISEETVDLNGFTVFTGRSNSGKSSIRRALELVLYNVWDKSFIKQGTEHCTVKLNIDDSNWIQITKPSNTYTVCVKGQVNSYPKVGKAVLEELEELGLDSFIDSEGYEHNVHVRCQTDPMFYLMGSKQEQSRIIASIFNFDNIKSVLKEAYNSKRSKESSAESEAKSLDELKVKLNLFSDKEKLLLSLSKLSTSKDTLLDFINLSDKENRLLSEFNELEYEKTEVQNTETLLSNLLVTTEWSESYALSTETTHSINEMTKINADIDSETLILKSLIKLYENQELIKKYTDRFNSNIELEDSLYALSKSKGDTKNDIIARKELLSLYGLMTVLVDYNKYSNSIFTLNSDIIGYTKELNLTTSLIEDYNRINSLNNYVTLYGRVENGSRALLTYGKRKKTFVGITNKLKRLYKLDQYKTITDNIVSLDNSVKALNIELMGCMGSLKECQVELNDSISCPNCGEDISEFIKGCGHVELG